MPLTVRDAIRRNYGAIYRFAYRMTGRREQAEDIAQETFLRLAANPSPARGAEGLRRWLFVVARNLCLSALRADTRHPSVPLAAVSESHATEATPAEAGQRNERHALVREAVLALPPAMREIVVLREYEGLAYAEIAAVLGCSTGTVKSRLARARATLGRRLAPLLEEER